jgi:hypothetical protein
MRLARTAAPLLRYLVGRTRTCDLRFPKPVGCQAPLRPAEEPPAGLEPAASGLRVRRHPVSTTGANGSGGRGRTCASRVTVARLTARPRRNDGSSRSRTCEAVPALRLSKALPYRSAMLPEGRRGSRTPQGLAGPPVFETGYRARGSPSSGTGRRRTCNLPIKSRVLCRVELRSHDVAGRNRTCGAPRFKRALYR